MKKIFDEGISECGEGGELALNLRRKRIGNFHSFKKSALLGDPVDQAAKYDNDQKIKDELPVFGHVRFGNCNTKVKKSGGLPQ